MISEISSLGHQIGTVARYCGEGNLDALLTLNAPDFKRFGLTVLTPADL